MLYFVKSRMKEDKARELSKLTEGEGFPYKARHVFASLKDHLVGLTFWEVGNKDDFESIKSKLEEFVDILDFEPVVSAEEVYIKTMEKKN
jgi:hypothetical protein